MRYDRKMSRAHLRAKRVTTCDADRRCEWLLAYAALDRSVEAGELRVVWREGRRIISEGGEQWVIGHIHGRVVTGGR